MLPNLAKNLNKFGRSYFTHYKFSSSILPKAEFSKTRETEELPYLELTRDFLDPKEFYEAI